MSLYQKYRPNKFNNVLSQKVVIKTLINGIKQNKINHAYVFAGPKGIGKTTIAKIFAKAVNCQNFKDDVCNQCLSCKAIDNENMTDIVELDAASNNGVEDIRNLLESTRFIPAALKYKVYIIDEAHMLSNSAWNSLLKTLEDPPKYVVFVFATTEMHKLPGTIVSRCQCFEFSRLANSELVNLVTKVANEQNIKISIQAVNLIVNLANGSGRDALSILEQVALYSDNDININHINEVFGLLVNQTKIQLINDLQNQNVASVIKLLNELEVKGINFTQLTLDLANLLLDALIFNQTNDQSLLKFLNIDELNSLNISNDLLIKLINQIQNGYNQIKTSQDPRFDFEVLLFSLIHLFDDKKQEQDIVKSNNKTITITKTLNQTTNKEQEHKVENKTLDVVKQKTEKNSSNLTKDSLAPPSFDIKEFVSLKEKKLKPDEPNVKQVKQNEKPLKVGENSQTDIIINPKIDALIFQTMAWHMKRLNTEEFAKIKNDANEKIKELIAKVPQYPALSFIANTTGSIFAISETSIIIHFKDKLDALMLNKTHFLDPEIVIPVFKTFKKPVYLLGMDSANKVKYIEAFKNKQHSFDQSSPDPSELIQIIESADPWSSAAKKALELADKNHD